MLTLVAPGHTLSSFALEHETAEEDLSSELNLDKECASKPALFKGALSFH